MIGWQRLNSALNCLTNVVQGAASGSWGTVRERVMADQKAVGTKALWLCEIEDPDRAGFRRSTRNLNLGLEHIKVNLCRQKEMGTKKIIGVMPVCINMVPSREIVRMHLRRACLFNFFDPLHARIAQEPSIPRCLSFIR
jgi:hypothetical protein